MKLAVVGIFALAAFLQAQPVPPDAGTFDLTGRVLDSDTSEPIARARVSIRGQRPQQRSFDEAPLMVLTGPDGTFRVTNVPAGRYSLESQRAGYIAVNAMRNSSSASFELNSTNPKAPPVTLYLRRQVAIEGSVLDENGGRARGSVNVFRLKLMEGQWVPVQSGRADVNDEGLYRIHSLKPGRYYVAFAPESSAQHTDRGASVVVFPGSPDLRGARILDLTSGQEQRADFRIETKPAWKVSGKVIASSSNAYVTIRRSNTSGLPIQDSTSGFYNHADGKFQYEGLASGDYVLELGWRENNRSLRALREITVRGGNLEGIVLDESSMQPPPQGIVRQEIDSGSVPRPPHLMARFRSDSTIIRANMNATGGLTMEGMLPGVYELSITTQPSVFVRSAMQDGRDVMRDGFVVSGSGSTAPLEITLGKAEARVEGTVDISDLRQDQSIRLAILRNEGSHWQLGQQIIAPPVPGNWQPSGNFQTMVEGKRKFVMPGVAPGDYLVFAWKPEDGEPQMLPYDTEEFLAKFGALFEKLHVEETGTKSVTISRLLPASAFVRE